MLWRVEEAKRQRLMLRWLARDPWLTSAQMAAVLGCKPASAATYLGELKAKGWVQSLAPREHELPREQVYALTDEGLREMARVKNRSVAEMAARYKCARAALIRILNDLPHHWRIREIVLCKLASHFGGLNVEWCWPRHFGQTFAFRDYNEKSSRLRPDCYGLVTFKERCYPFFLLWDDGLFPMQLERRRIRPFEKAQPFDHFGFDFWTFPSVVIVAHNPARAQQYRERLRSAYNSSLRVFVSDQVTLSRAHPRAPIWWRGLENTSFGQRDEDERARLLEGAYGIPVNEYRLNIGWDDPTWLETADLSALPPAPQRVIGPPLGRLRHRSTGQPRTGGKHQLLKPLACFRLALCLSPQEKQTLRMIGALRVLTLDQLARFFDTSIERCRRWLTHLTRLGLVLELETPARCFLPAHQKLYVLSRAGLDLTARQCHQPLKRFRLYFQVMLFADGTRLLHERLVPHQLECVERMLALHEAARATSGSGEMAHTLCHWSGERSAILVWKSERYDRYGHQLLDKLRPDAYGVYAIGTNLEEFWMEVDRGKQMFRSSQWVEAGHYSFATKVRAYFAYVKRLQWLDMRPPRPMLLVITKYQRRATELRRVFVEVAQEQYWGHLPLRVFVTTAQRFSADGPLAAIWQSPKSDTSTYCFKALREAAATTNTVSAA